MWGSLVDNGGSRGLRLLLLLKLLELGLLGANHLQESVLTTKVKRSAVPMTITSRATLRRKGSNTVSGLGPVISYHLSFLFLLELLMQFS